MRHTAYILMHTQRNRIRHTEENEHSFVCIITHTVIQYNYFCWKFKQELLFVSGIFIACTNITLIYIYVKICNVENVGTDYKDKHTSVCIKKYKINASVYTAGDKIRALSSLPNFLSLSCIFVSIVCFKYLKGFILCICMCT